MEVKLSLKLEVKLTLSLKLIFFPSSPRRFLEHTTVKYLLPLVLVALIKYPRTKVSKLFCDSQHAKNVEEIFLSEI